jgi:hypothetical protein
MSDLHREHLPSGMLRGVLVLDPELHARRMSAEYREPQWASRYVPTDQLPISVGSIIKPQDLSESEAWLKANGKRAPEPKPVRIVKPTWPKPKSSVYTLSGRFCHILYERDDWMTCEDLRAALLQVEPEKRAQYGRLPEANQIGQYLSRGRRNREIESRLSGRKYREVEFRWRRER